MSTKIRRLLRSTAALVLLAALALSACEGGSTPPPSTPTPTPTPTPSGPPLREVATAGQRLVGAALQSGYLANEPLYAQAAAREHDYATAEYEMKWDPIEATRGVWNFTGADAIVDFARRNNMRVKGHALIWHGATPSWVNGLSANELEEVMREYIQTVVSHFRGQVYAWDVVNEAIGDDAAFRQSVFYAKLGPGYIAEAFRLAHAADPNALLLYNDYNAEGRGAKSDAVYNLVRGLKEQGVPIDGVGLQMHLTAGSYPAPADIASNMRRLADLGLRVNISEMDVRIASIGGATPANLQTQRTVYHDVVAVCAAEPRCDAVTFWGVSDAHSWIDIQFGPDDPLLFDEQYRAKPAYFGVRDALQGR